ncbi:MAG: LamG-like jellyroll fold domain-containing protein, partial [Phycisphaerae bacterium]
MENRMIIALTAMLWAASAASAAAAPTLVEGRFGRGFSPVAEHAGWAEAPYRVEYGKLPITFECWVRVDETTTDTVIASFGSTAENGHHWAIICHAGPGEIGLQAAALTPETFRSRITIGDGKWHYVAMLLEERRARVIVDGAEAINATAEPGHKRKLAGPLCFGGYYHLFSAGYYQSRGDRQSLHGVIDEARLSKGVREIRETPSGPFEADSQTLGLWHFDEIAGNHSPDASTLNNAVFVPDIAGKSMDQLDMEEFDSPRSMLDGEATTVELQVGAGSHPPAAPSLSLDGDWDMREDKRPVPDSPATAEAQTIGLWRFDDIRDGRLADDSTIGNAIAVAPADTAETLLAPG